MSNKQNRICWITPDYFLDSDSGVVPILAQNFTIRWLLILTKNSKRLTDGLVSKEFLPEEIHLKYKQKDPRVILQYIQLMLSIRKQGFDLIYFSFHGLPYFFPILFLFIEKKKIIYAAHNVTTPKGASNERLMRIYHWFAFRHIKQFHVFSKYQLEAIKRKFPKKRHFYAPLALKDFGTADEQPPSQVIRFLFFGYIREYKRLDILLESFQELYAFNRNIELHIAGDCENWAKYKAIIKYPEAIKCRIEIIPNKAIPNIVSSCHYLVLPYQDGAQSGVLTLAYKFNKPIIASNIPAFKQFVVDKCTGLFFESGSRESLTNVLKYAVEKHGKEYERMQEKLQKFVDEEFSMHEILRKYKSFLTECIQIRKKN